MTAETQAPILTVDGLTSGYGSSMILRDVSLTLAPGEILAVLGKNGMGKSTLLKTIMGYLAAETGRIDLCGTDVTGSGPHILARMGVSYTPQEFTIFQDLSVSDNLRIGLPSDAMFKARLDDIATLFPRMLERLKQRAGTLSGGEQKMLLMARAILVRPKVMLIDEISEGLQPTMIERMAEVLTLTRNESGTAVLLIEQNLSFALSIADRYAVLKRGEIVEDGPVSADTALIANFGRSTAL